MNWGPLLTVEECVTRWVELGLPRASNPLAVMFGLVRCGVRYDVGRCDNELGHEGPHFISGRFFKSDHAWYQFREGFLRQARNVDLGPVAPVEQTGKPVEITHLENFTVEILPPRDA
jgi:hypothetical protein